MWSLQTDPTVRDYDRDYGNRGVAPNTDNKGVALNTVIVYLIYQKPRHISQAWLVLVLLISFIHWYYWSQNVAGLVMFYMIAGGSITVRETVITQNAINTALIVLIISSAADLVRP